jgi:N-formylglutamate amidohydrolase
MVRNRSVAMMTLAIVVTVVMPRRRYDQTLASGKGPQRSSVEYRQADSDSYYPFHNLLRAKLARNRACFKVRSRRAHD